MQIQRFSALAEGSAEPDPREPVHTGEPNGAAQSTAPGGAAPSGSFMAALTDWGLPLIWLAGTAACALFLLTGALRLSLRLRRSAAPPAPASLGPLLDRCRDRLGIRRRVPVLTADCLRSPAVTGLLFPRILLPAYAAEMGEESLEYVLLHELSHCRRGDLLLYRLMLLLQAVHWFNPLLWPLFRCMRQDMELANDSAVLRVIGPPRHRDYGRSLVEVLGRSRGFSPFPGLLCMTDGGGQMERRLRSIRRSPVFRSRPLLFGAVSLLVIAAIGAVFLTVRGDSAPVAAARQYLAELADSESVLRLSVNSVREVSDPKHIENILSDPDAYRMRLSRDNISLVDASIDVQYDNTKVPYDSGEDKDIRFVLVRQSKASPWVIAEMGQGRGGVPYLALDRLNQALALLDGKTDYVGNNSKAGAILSALLSPEGLALDHFSLQTAAEPYGITVHYAADPGVWGFYGVSGNQGALKQNAALLLALIRNAGYVEMEVGEDHAQVMLRFSREEADALVGGDIREYTAHSGRLLTLLSLLDEALPIVSPDLPSVSKGLELYIYKDPAGSGGTVFSLLPGTDRQKTEEEIYGNDAVYRSTDEVNEALAAYPGAARLAIYHMNATDFSKEEMSELSDRLSLRAEDYTVTVGLWEPEP